VFIKVDPDREVIDINGTNYSWCLFEHFGCGIGPTRPDELLKIIKREDGVVTVRVVHNEQLSKAFDSAYETR